MGLGVVGLGVFEFKLSTIQYHSMKLGFGLPWRSLADPKTLNPHQGLKFDSFSPGRHRELYHTSKARTRNLDQYYRGLNN